MAYDKVVDSTVLDGYFSDIADAIRDKDGTENEYTPAQMPQAIEDLPIDDGMLAAIIEDGGVNHDLRYEYKNNDLSYMYLSPFKGYDSQNVNNGLRRIEARSVTFVPTAAFQYCYSLTEVVLPALKKIPNYCFAGDAQLVTLDLSSCTEIGGYAFYQAGPVTFESDTVETVKGSAFRYAKAQTIKLHNLAATGIQTNAFYQAQKLVTLDLKSKSGSFSIQSSACYDCSLLTALILRDTTMDTLAAAAALSNTPIASGTGYIYVPRNLIATYQAATNWVTYSSQFRALEDYTVDGTIDGDLDPTKI